MAAVIGVAVASAGVARRARADEYEASVAVAGEAGLARVGEDGTREVAVVPAGGVALAASYGLSNLVAVDVELAGGTCGRATFADTTVVIGGVAQPPGTLARTTRYGRALVGATLRLGVRWIPTLGLGAGVGVRVRGGGSFTNAQVMDVTPDDDGNGVALDVLVAAHAGLDYRIGAHAIAGVTVSAAHAFAVDAPGADAVTAALHVAYYWYPLW